MSDGCECYGQFKKKREWDGMHFVYGVCQELPKRRSMRIGKERMVLIYNLCMREFYLMNRCLSCGELLQGFFVHKEFTEKLALAIDKC